MKTYEVKIEFCMQCNYAPKAASFAEELFTHFRSNITKMELIPGSGGEFEVIVNGEKVYSKGEIGLFPKAKDIIEKML
ncbi:selenoprotein W-related protein [Cytobacillus eiseniae]|uniref:Selenoprotein W-related protein n=1 Tax=Cytobacillus eiseniae TaxID=762947 RepID=A0ABS4RKH8_9BACI|nr:Rdx family protein [Cytobacillus eiseniae]MBP2242297.1 selenoprotein W-related protein [Cytobacillus eiseniae]